ncbi:GNAT family N-acetyltransferase [Hymenobacter sp. BT664]|uniref:GNAT family N-acetyltransferase n=1 Tax=Hymenobacter montanus TaxID=2771359 RepID=A0A927BCK9_9BACT|nr:GNAT family N-acetyltransferase [Hymenobacter montanus]MBD2767597.1 GNAT family N-acetyltransferase [Hymenobacter montanus]
MIFSDKHLAQRLEQAEAQANANFIEARCRLMPESEATWTKLAGAYLLFDGVGSPLTQSFGLGLFDEVGPAELEQVEQFFAQRHTPVCLEISSLADASFLALLPTRGYRPIEYTSVLYRELSPLPHPTTVQSGPLTTRRITAAEVPVWAHTSAEGWRPESPDLGDFVLAYGQISASSDGAEPFLAELNGHPIATGGLFVHQDVALLMGASTIATGRRQGAQSALLEARLCFAAAKGCTLAMMGALPGSQSQRNAEKNGFRIAYTRLKWQLELPLK